MNDATQYFTLRSGSSTSGSPASSQASSHSAQEVERGAAQAIERGQAKGAAALAPTASEVAGTLAESGQQHIVNHWATTTDVTAAPKCNIQWHWMNPRNAQHARHKAQDTTHTHTQPHHTPHTTHYTHTHTLHTHYTHTRTLCCGTLLRAYSVCSQLMRRDKQHRWER